MNNPLPNDVSPPPEGTIFLGKGNTFIVPADGFDGWCFNPYHLQKGDGVAKWTRGFWYGAAPWLYYAAVPDSEVVRINSNKDVEET